MSNEKTTTIIVRLRSQNHPMGQRTRAGYTFNTEPREVEVTNDQFLAIKNDPYLQIMKKREETAPKAPENTGNEEEKQEINLDRATKKQLVEILETELGQKAGVDFDPEASNKILAAAIRDLREKKAEEKDDGQDPEDDGNSGDDDGDDKDPLDFKESEGDDE